MITDYTVESLRAFEADIAEEFNAGKIRAPVHLDGGNEQQLIDIFKDVKPDDWIAGSWRQHFHCLLKGVPPGLLKADILAGKSITLCYPFYRVISSAIVGGILPIALGLAREIKRRGGSEKVWCFMGDMTSATGTAHECFKYAENFSLPIQFVIENNEKSVCTDTGFAWGHLNNYVYMPRTVINYHYHPIYPHAGAGKRINF